MCTSCRVEDALRKIVAQGPASHETLWRDEGKVPGTEGGLWATGSIVFARKCKMGVLVKAPHKENN